MVTLPKRGYDGWEFLQRLKQTPRTRNIPVVVVSGHVQGAWRERAARDGFAAFFPKPCLPEELADGLRFVLDRMSNATAAHCQRDDDTMTR